MEELCEARNVRCNSGMNCPCSLPKNHDGEHALMLNDNHALCRWPNVATTPAALHPEEA